MQLDALVTQATERSFEVVISDNEGSDELESIVADYRAKLDVRIVDSHDIRGPRHARNVGARAARSPYLAICDSDDVVSPNWVEAMYLTLDAGDVLATGPLRLDRLNPPHVMWTFLSSGASTRSFGDHPTTLGIYTFLNYLPFACGCNIGIRRSTYFVIGGMDESQRGGAEDVDLSWRAQEAGHQIVYNPDAIVDYRLRGEARQVFAQRRRYSRSQMRFWRLSVDLGRPVQGMSMRWAVTSTLKLPAEYLRARREGTSARYAFAYRAGAIVGNLEGQLSERLFKPRRPRKT